MRKFISVFIVLIILSTIISCIKTQETSIENSVSTDPIKTFSPEMISSFSFPDNALSFYIEGNYAYILGWESFQIIDITNKETPIALSSLNIEINQFDPWPGVIIEDDFAYFTYRINDNEGYSKETGIKIIDIVDKKNPIEVGDYKVPYLLGKIYLKDEYIYATYNISEKIDENSFQFTDGGLKIIDVSDKKNPVEVSNMSIGAMGAFNVFVEDNYAYVIYGTYIEIIDIADKKSPKNVKEINFNVPILNTSLFIENNYLYLSIEDTINIYEVSNKKKPTFIGNAILPEEDGLIYTDIYTESSYLYTTTHINSFNSTTESYLQIIDARDKQNPVIVNKFPILGQAVAVRVQNGYAYVASVFNGLYIFKLSE